MTRHFPRMRALNHGDMRWKKFFYRQICTDPGLALTCEEHDTCFAPEEGVALLRH